jgi:hypothetical protein
MLGMLFSLLPAATAVPHDRVLLFSGVGASAVLSWFLIRIFHDQQYPARLARFHVKAVGVFLVVCHLILSPLLMPLMAYSVKFWSDQIDAEPTKFAALDDIESRRLVLFGPPLGSALAILPLRYYRQERIPERIWTISTLNKDFQFEQVGQNELLVRLDEGFIQHAEAAVRDFNRYPFREGEQVQLSGLAIAIEDLNDKGMPTQLRLIFDRPLVDSNLVFLRWSAKEKRYEEVIWREDEGGPIPGSLGAASMSPHFL